MDDIENSQLCIIAQALAAADNHDDWRFIITEAKNQPDRSEEFYELMTLLLVAFNRHNIGKAEIVLRLSGKFAHHLNWAINERRK